MEQKIRERMELLRTMAPGSIGDQLGFELVDCGEDWCLLRCQTAPWMRNPFGTLHGGMSAAIADQAMGFLANAVIPEGSLSPTVQMQTVYHAPMKPGKPVLARVQVTAQSRTLTHLSCQLMMEGAPEKLCVSATSIYYVTEPKK